MANCSVCGSRFAEKKCYFCQNHVCTACIVPDDVSRSATTVKCVVCQRKGVEKLSFLAVVKRNKFILGVLAGFWIFTVFPVPFINLAGYEGDVLISILQPVLITTGLMTIPFILMMIAWQRKAPKQN
jgi:hypothetical protein